MCVGMCVWERVGGGQTKDCWIACERRSASEKNLGMNTGLASVKYGREENFVDEYAKKSPENQHKKVPTVTRILGLLPTHT